MEVDQIQCKFPRISNGYSRLASISQSEKMDDQCPPDEQEGENKRSTANDGGGVDLGRFYGWPSSRIVRVSRASGGKDRHSKVLTSKGLRDRRVRLSVNTAIQFYDLQDRLGYDQPSKAVEWLLTAAASSIAELPPMNANFPDTPKQMSDEKKLSDQLGFSSVANDGGGVDGRADPKSSACSSNSDTSKGSVSRSESRIKARERAKGRVAEKEKEKEKDESSYVASFTELLSGGISNINVGCNRGNGEDTDELRGWSSSPMDCFTTGHLLPPATRPGSMVVSPLFSVAADHHPELQPFLFTPENLVSGVNGGNNDRSSEYNLNFTISSANSSGLANFNRGTLQSNSSSSPPLLPPPNFFNGATAPTENHHHLLSEFDARLHLYYGDSHGRHSVQQGKEKS